MTTNLKEYTLLSLGDSFTFGQGTVPPHNKEGDKVMINSETLNYVEKAKD